MSHYTTESSHRLPPYGKSVRATNGRQLRISYGWQANEPRNDSLVLPDDKPSKYKWPVSDCDVFVSPASKPIPPTVAQELFDALVANGANTIVIFGTRMDNYGNLAGLHFWPDAILETSR